ncbi:MAG: hypothetical protein JO254_08280 [Pseudolabrys sp.]|nr:hypothetical protein [Pseudolabrys sp.]
MTTHGKPPAGGHGEKRGDIIQDERGQEQPTNKETAKRSSGNVKPEQQPQSPGMPAGGE